MNTPLVCYLSCDIPQVVIQILSSSLDGLYDPLGEDDERRLNVLQAAQDPRVAADEHVAEEAAVQVGVAANASDGRLRVLGIKEAHLKMIFFESI